MSSSSSLSTPLKSLRSCSVSERNVIARWSSDQSSAALSKICSLDASMTPSMSSKEQSAKDRLRERSAPSFFSAMAVASIIAVAFDPRTAARKSRKLSKGAVCPVGASSSSSSSPASRLQRPRRQQ